MAIPPTNGPALLPIIAVAGVKERVEVLNNQRPAMHGTVYPSLKEAVGALAGLQPARLVWALDGKSAPWKNMGDGFQHYQCDYADAILAGSFLGKTGMLQMLDTGHVLVREDSARSRRYQHHPGSLRWLHEQSRELIASGQLPPSSQKRWENAFANVATPAEAYRALLELADYPGPDAAALALISKGGRQLADYIRAVHGRSRLGKPPTASWHEFAMEGPLWEAMQFECKRHIGEVRWKPPAGSAALGALLLLLGEKEEHRRLETLGKSVEEAEGLRHLSEESWRQLKRGGRWLDPWKKLASK